MMKDGSVYAGTVRELGNGSISITPPLGVESTVVRQGDVANTIKADVSSMPPMGAVLTKRELRDIVEYLATLHAAPAADQH